MIKSLGLNPHKGSSEKQYLDTEKTAALCKDALKAAYGDLPCQAKAAAKDAGFSPKAAEKWLGGQNPMSLSAFLNAYRNSVAFRAWAKKIMLMETEHDPAFQAELARFIRAAQTVASND